MGTIKKIDMFLNDIELNISEVLNKKEMEKLLSWSINEYYLTDENELEKFVNDDEIIKEYKEFLSKK